MSSFAFSVLFIVFLAISLSVRFWLGSRQIRHVIQHRSAVPPEFAEKFIFRRIKRPQITPLPRPNLDFLAYSSMPLC